MRRLLYVLLALLCTLAFIVCYFLTQPAAKTLSLKESLSHIQQLSVLKIHNQVTFKCIADQENGIQFTQNHHLLINAYITLSADLSQANIDITPLKNKQGQVNIYLPKPAVTNVEIDFERSKILETTYHTDVLGFRLPRMGLLRHDEERGDINACYQLFVTQSKEKYATKFYITESEQQTEQVLRRFIPEEYTLNFHWTSERPPKFQTKFSQFNTDSLLN